jgi:hypothetical protein
LYWHRCKPVRISKCWEIDRRTVWKGSKNCKACTDFDSIAPHRTRDRSNILRVCRPQYRGEATTQPWGPTNRVHELLPIPSGAVGNGDQATNIPRLLPLASTQVGQTYTGGIARIKANHRYRPRVPTRRAPGSTSDACGLRTLRQDWGEPGYALRRQWRSEHNDSALVGAFSCVLVSNKRATEFATRLYAVPIGLKNQSRAALGYL